MFRYLPVSRPALSNVNSKLIVVFVFLLILGSVLFCNREKKFDSYHENSYEVRLVKLKAGTSFGNASL